MTGLVLSLLLPSTALIQKYFGVSGVVAYLVVGTAVLLFAWRFLFRPLEDRISSKVASWLAVIVFLALAIVFFVVYPLADSGVLGAGSDRDEALNIAVERLLNGEYPYYGRTYFDNPISPMPGAVLLAIPFVLAGTSAYQSLFWVVALFFVVRALTDARSALLLICVMFAGSPILLQEVLTGGDLLANSIYILVFALWNVRLSQLGGSSWQLYLPAIFLGIAISSRANMIFLLPLIFFATVYAGGLRNALKSMAVTVAAFASVTVPFYLYDSQGFTPLQTTNRFEQFESTFPLAGLLVPALTVTIAIVLAIKRENRDLQIFLRNCTIVLAVPILMVVVIASIASDTLNLDLISYGIPFLIFGVLSAWMKLQSKRP